MNIVKIPSRHKFKPVYWDIHGLFNRNLFAKNAVVTEDDELRVTEYGYEAAVLMDQEWYSVLFDYGDSHQIKNYPNGYDAIFKTHLHESLPGIFPWSPVSFTDWDLQEHLSKTFKQNNKAQMISYQTNAYGNALDRRRWCRMELEKLYGNLVDTKFVHQTEWFNQLRKSKVYVHVPGWCNNMIDRSTLQCMMIGMPVMTTKLPELLPWNIRLEAGVDYILMKDDYSNLADMDQLLVDSETIAQSAKIKTVNNLTPEHMMEWMYKCLRSL